MSEPQYPPAPVGPPPVYVRAPTNGLAVTSMVLGILGVVGLIWIISPILALVFGYVAKGQIDRAGGAQEGRGMAIAGIVLGWVGLVLGIAMLLWMWVFFTQVFPAFPKNFPTTFPTPFPTFS
jgi:hypothetical protein